jgi:hypothetical protein
MADKSITRINVSNFGVSIIGLKEIMEELAGTHADKSDEELQSLMTDRLSQENYIPSKVKNDYGKAFVREFRKFMGQPFTEDAPRGLDVKVLGAGCSQCRALTQTIMEILTELQLPAGVDHITDMKEIARYRVMGSPALIINGKTLAVGSVPPKDRIKKWLLEANAAQGGK